MSPAEARVCPRCHGGGVATVGFRCMVPSLCQPIKDKCSLCNGLGEVPPEVKARYLRSIERDGDHD